MLAGGKVAKVDRVEWIAIPDANSAVNALLAGEIDLIEAPPADLQPLLRADKNVALFGWNALGGAGDDALQSPASAVQQREGAAGSDDALAIGGPAARAGRRSRPLSGVQRAVHLRRTVRQGVRRPADQARPRQGAGAAEGERLRRHADRHAAPDRPRLVQPVPAGRQAAARARGLQGRSPGDGLEHRGRAARPQGAAGAGRLEHLLHHQPDGRHRQPRHQQLRRRRRARRRGSAGRAIRRSRSCAPNSSTRPIRPSAWRWVTRSPTG